MILQCEYFFATRGQQWLEELVLLFQTFIGVDIKQGPLFVTFIRGGRQFMRHPLIQIQTKVQIRIHLQMHLI